MSMVSRAWIDARLLLAIGAVVVCLAYWAGLRGSFLLDDSENLTLVQQFARGEATWIGPVLNNASGPLGRPLSMASFVVTAAVGGFTPFAFLAGNLFLHLSIGATLGIVLVLGLRLDSRLANHAERIGALLTIWWWLLPTHVSTVLYAVQRMAQLSALFVALGLVAYLVMRQRLAAEPASRWRALQLFMVVAAITVLAALSKENGLLLPLLCFALEITWFSNTASGKREALRIHALLVGVPALLAIPALWVFQTQLLGQYEARDFTLIERLMTQPRVLWDYAYNLLIPASSRLGLFHDDYPISRALSTPASTAPALLAWLAVLALALRLRRTSPTFSIGILLFLGGHAMESGVFPLEIYFEHRNYLPGIGLLLAVVGAVAHLKSRVSKTTPSLRVALSTLPFLLLSALAFATHSWANVWRSTDLMLAHAEINHPESARVHAIAALRALDAGRLEAASAHFDAAAASLRERDPGTVMLWRMLLACATGAAPDPAQFEAALPPRPSLFVLQAAILVASRAETGSCAGFRSGPLAALYARWSEKLQIPGTDHASWRIRFLTARLFASAGQWASASNVGYPAWRDSGWNPDIGAFLIQVANAAGDRNAATAYLAQLEQTAPRWNLRIWTAIERFRAHLQATADADAE